MFSARSELDEDIIMREVFNGDGPDREDVDMFKLALQKLKNEKDELVDGIHWAYYPSDILL